MDQREPSKTKEDQERYPQEEEELKICVSVLDLAIHLRSEKVINIPPAMGRAMECYLRHLRQGRKAQCQSLQQEC